MPPGPPVLQLIVVEVYRPEEKTRNATATKITKVFEKAEIVVDTVHTLPGLAPDEDPRFPFFDIFEEINKVEKGAGNRIDSYLQLKTVPEEVLKGKIIIDSPGFDADPQRDTTLKITNHIVDMSDLVLVFFDARRPEPGTMRDTLEHLVKAKVNRNDSDKILYILN